MEIMEINWDVVRAILLDVEQNPSKSYNVEGACSFIHLQVNGLDLEVIASHVSLMVAMGLIDGDGLHIRSSKLPGRSAAIFTYRISETGSSVLGLIRNDQVSPEQKLLLNREISMPWDHEKGKLVFSVLSDFSQN